MSKRNVVHIEIPAGSTQSAAQFYEALFGWKMQHVPEFDYTMWEDGGGYGGGFNKVDHDNPVGLVLVYIHSDDIDADLKQVEKLGGGGGAHHAQVVIGRELKKPLRAPRSFLVAVIPFLTS